MNSVANKKVSSIPPARGSARLCAEKPAGANESVFLDSEAGATSTERHRRLSFAAALACIVLVAIDLRPGIVSIGPLLPQIREEFGISNTQASLLTAIPNLLMGLLALATPGLARGYGRDRVILISLALLTVATAARAFVGSTGLLLVTTAGVGAGIAIVGSLIAGYIKAKFPKHVALLMGIYAMSIGLGSTIAAAATGVIASSGAGWRWGSGIWALPGLIAMAAWLVVARTEKQSAAANSSQPAAKRYPLPVSSVTAWLVAFYFAANNILFFGLLSWIAPMYRGHGMGETTAGLVLASFTAAFMLANPLPGLISRSEDRRIPIGIFAGISFVGILAVAVAPHFMPFLVMPIIACGIGGSFTLGMTLPLDNASTPDEANAWNAFVMTIGYFMGAAGPLVVGVLRDLTGGFEAPMWTLGVVAVLMLGMAPFLQPRHYRAEKREELT